MTVAITPLIDHNHFGWQTMAAPLDREKREFLDRYVTGPTVLDAGCATGVYTDYLAAKGFRVTGVDSNHDLLDKAKKRNPRIHWVKGDITQNNLHLHPCDTVIAFDVLEHLNEEAGFRALWSLTKKRLLISVPQTTDVNLTKLYLLYGHHLDTTHLRTYTEAKLRMLAKTYHGRLTKCLPSHALATEALALEIWEGNLILKRLGRRLLLLFLKPKKYYTNLLAVFDKDQEL